MSEPGRQSYEWSLAVSAIALLFPWVGLIALWLSHRSRRAGSERWISALAAGIWCIIVGVIARMFFGFPLFP